MPPERSRRGRNGTWLARGIDDGIGRAGDDRNTIRQEDRRGRGQVNCSSLFRHTLQRRRFGLAPVFAEANTGGAQPRLSSQIASPGASVLRTLGAHRRKRARGDVSKAKGGGATRRGPTACVVSEADLRPLPWHYRGLSQQDADHQQTGVRLQELRVLSSPHAGGGTQLVLGSNSPASLALQPYSWGALVAGGRGFEPPAFRL